MDSSQSRIRAFTGRGRSDSISGAVERTSWKLRFVTLRFLHRWVWTSGLFSAVVRFSSATSWRIALTEWNKGLSAVDDLDALRHLKF